MGYNIIKKLFGRKQKETPEQEQEQEPEPEFIISIVIGAKDSGELDVKCEWHEENDKTIVALAEILFHLESGFLGPYVQNILLGHMSENPEAQDFIVTALNIFTDMSQSTSGSPLVKPSDVFRGQDN